ncbi:ABC transporter permease [Mesohalobacter halotolerans]|uniref:FtsX-like permease family protein n=1 Tax=Mesohalobacter halotolerans TaxID=1883405 RepID=A0A4U5TQW6_9FLAO|nr:FtsX-like permease family protein [Mesohalobacter halotolerans]TKS56617.1 FtsX-like permease family protein [Mesohalobacter halotolerans]
MHKHSKPGLGWIFKMAWRDGKASRKKLSLFMASIVLGIAAVVSIQSFSENLKTTITQESKALMGADFKIDSDNPPDERVQQIMDSLGGFQAREVSFASMAAFPQSKATKLMQVRGIEGAFPFYGELETLPVDASQTFQTQAGALVDATTMLQLDIKLGDSIKIGQVTLPVLGQLNSAPGSTAVFSSVAPPVIIPYRFIPQTGLVQTGSQIEYDFYFKAPKADLKALDKKIDPILDNEDADLDTHKSTSERLGERYDNFGKFLNLVAFIAVLLGCVGIASSIYIYIKEKLKAVAVLKCLGANKNQAFLIFLIQVGFMGLIGGVLGTLLGVVFQQFFPWLLEGLLPVDVTINYAIPIMLFGIALGVLMSILFALYPLIGTLYISPLQALRIVNEKTTKSIKAKVLVSLGIFGFIVFFTFWLLKEWEYVLGFVGGVLMTFSVLYGLAYLFMQSIKRYFPQHWGFVARQSLLNLFRPQNQTLTLILSIGVGTFLISTLYFTKDLLLDQASLESDANNPNLILLDVQSDQRADLKETLYVNDLPVIRDVPIVTMRVERIDGQPVDNIRKDSTSQVNRWILNHEFRTTYRDQLIDSETLQSGTWTSEIDDNTLVPVSVSNNFAEDARVEVGDQLVFNVQGVLLETVVGSIRTVDWSQMDLNFSLVFPKGVLEEAPQFRVITTKVPDEKTSAKLQQELVKLFPNVSIIDLRQVLSILEDLLGKMSLIINFMAFFSILTGVIVLIGAIKTSKFQRIRESVLLRTLGAKSQQILKINALEYLYLGVLGALSGVLLSLLSSQLLAIFVFKSAFVPSLIPFLVLFPGIVILVLFIGLSNSLGVIKKPPLVILRKKDR